MLLSNGNLLLEHGATDVGEFLLHAYQQLGINYPKFYKMDRLSKLALIACEVLFDGSTSSPLDPLTTAVVLTNSHSSLDADVRYNESIDRIPSPALFVYTLPNIMIGEICIKHGFKGENAMFVFDQFNADFLHRYVTDLLDNSGMTSCICGWVDVYNNDYKAVLYLVSITEEEKSAIPFTKDNIQNIYDKKHGEVNV